MFRAFARYAQPAGRSDRAMALGCFAELCVELPPELAADFGTLQPLLRPHAATNMRMWRAMRPSDWERSVKEHLQTRSPTCKARCMRCSH